MNHENKSIPVTFRVTPREYEELKQKAKGKGQSISRFVTDKLAAKEGVTPTQLREVYLHLLKIKDAARIHSGSQWAENMEKECDEIWRCL